MFLPNVCRYLAAQDSPLVWQCTPSYCALQLNSDEFQWLVGCKCASWLLWHLHLAWHLTVYRLVVCRSGANVVKAEIKAEEVKTEDGQTEVST